MQQQTPLPPLTFEQQAILPEFRACSRRARDAALALWAGRPCRELVPLVELAELREWTGDRGHRPELEAALVELGTSRRAGATIGWLPPQILLYDFKHGVALWDLLWQEARAPSLEWLERAAHRLKYPALDNGPASPLWSIWFGELLLKVGAFRFEAFRRRLAAVKCRSHEDRTRVYNNIPYATFSSSDPELVRQYIYRIRLFYARQYLQIGAWLQAPRPRGRRRRSALPWAANFDPKTTLPAPPGSEGSATPSDPVDVHNSSRFATLAAWSAKGG